MAQFSLAEEDPLDPDRSQHLLSPDRPISTRANCLIASAYCFGKGVLNVAQRPSNYDAFQGVTVDAFKTRNLKAIPSLKKFLTALPSPSYIKNVLLQAIYQLAEQDPETCRWVLQHRQYLEPELNLLDIAQQIATEQLQRQGLLLTEDFDFTIDGRLESSELVKSILLETISGGDRLLIEEILFNH